MRLDSLRILVENCSVDKFVLLSRLELHAIGVTESFHHAIELRIEDDFLEAAHYLIKIVIIFVTCAMVRHFKVL